MSKIKSEKGIVTFVMRAGKDKVRHQMSIGTAQGIIKMSENVVETDTEIIVDDTYFFPVEARDEVEDKTRKKKSAEVTEDE